jgi:hypothetical protein
MDVLATTNEARVLQDLDFSFLLGLFAAMKDSLQIRWLLRWVKNGVDWGHGRT